MWSLLSTFKINYGEFSKCQGCYFFPREKLYPEEVKNYSIKT